MNTSNIVHSLIAFWNMKNRNQAKYLVQHSVVGHIGWKIHADIWEVDLFFNLSNIGISICLKSPVSVRL